MNAGRVELDLVAVGKDQVSAMLRTLEGNVKRTAAEMGKAGAATTTFGGAVDSLKEKAAGVNKVREAFENLRSNTFFLTSAIAGLGFGAVALIRAFDTDVQAIEKWRNSFQDTEKAIGAARTAYENLATALGNRTQTQIQRTAEEAKKEWESLAPKIDDAANATAALTRKMKELEEEAARDPMARLLIERQDAIGRLADERRRSIEQENNLERERRNIENEIADAMKTQTDLMGGIVGISADIKRAQGLFTQPFFLQYPAPQKPPKPTGGRRRGDPNAVFRFAGSDGALLGVDNLSPNQLADFTPNGVLSRGLNLDALPGAGGGGNDQGDLLTQQKEKFDALTAAVNRFSSAMAPVLDEVFPGLGTSIEGVDAIMAAFAETTDRTAKAQVQAASTGAAAVLGGIGQIMGGKRGLFVGEGLGEEAAAIASLAVGDLAGFGLHQAAAGGYFVAAAAMGGGGGKGGGGGGGSRGGGGGRGGGYEGPKTVINNFSTLVTDPHQVTRAISQTTRSTRGSGSDQRRGG